MNKQAEIVKINLQIRELKEKNVEEFRLFELELINLENQKIKLENKTIEEEEDSDENQQIKPIKWPTEDPNHHRFTEELVIVNQQIRKLKEN